MDAHPQPESHTMYSLLAISHTTAVCGLVTVIAGIIWMFQRPSRLPPGPPVYVPGLGHLLRLAGNPLQEFRSLRQKYGDVFRLYLGSRLVVVINGVDVINEVLQVRGSEFSHRPPSFLSEKIAENKGLLNTSGPVWSQQRQNMMKTMRTLASSGGHLNLYLETEVERLTEKLTEGVHSGKARNIDLGPFMRKATCSIGFSMVYGRVLDFDSQELEMYTDIMAELFRYFGLLAVVNFIPFVHLLPGDPVCYHRCLQLVKKLENEVIKPEIQRLLQMHDGNISDNNGNFKGINNNDNNNNNNIETASKSFIGGYIEEMLNKRSKNIKTELNEEQLTKAAGDVMAGSYDTIANTLLWLVLYMVHHQDVQERCRNEVVQALHRCGGHVTDADRSELVYTQATIMEVQRLANVAPLPPPHCCNRDTTLFDYVIPKDTIIMTNMDSLMMGPEVGDNPEKFRPERFIGQDGDLLQPRWFMPYATGSRMCMGANIAKKELLAITVGLLSKFKITSPVVDGQVKIPSLQGDLGLTHVPRQFTVCLEPVS